MAVRPKKLIPGTLLTTSLATLYATPESNITKVFEIVLCNTDATQTVGVDIHFVDSGDGAGAKNKTFSEGVGGLNLAPLETKVIGLEQRMTAGDSIQAKASVTSLVSIRASGDEIA